MSTDGWLHCEQGHKHWGLAGAAGLLLRSVTPEGFTAYLLQHRGEEVHHGGTWSLLGGALHEGEDALEAALREASEECENFDSEAVQILAVLEDSHGGWSYHTVVAEVPYFEAVGSGWETGEEGLVWVRAADFARLSLHPGFAASLDALTPHLSE